MDGSTQFSLRSFSSSVVAHLSIIIYHRKDFRDCAYMSRRPLVHTYLLVNLIHRDKEHTLHGVEYRFAMAETVVSTVLQCDFRHAYCVDLFSQTALFSKEGRDIEEWI